MAVIGANFTAGIASNQSAKLTTTTLITTTNAIFTTKIPKDGKLLTKILVYNILNPYPTTLDLLETQA